MTRAILVLLMLAVAVLAAGAVQGVATRLGRPAARGDGLPRTSPGTDGVVRKVAYGLLLVILFGTTIGWLGS